MPSAAVEAIPAGLTVCGPDASTGAILSASATAAVPALPLIVNVQPVVVLAGALRYAVWSGWPVLPSYDSDQPAVTPVTVRPPSSVIAATMKSLSVVVRLPVVLVLAKPWRAFSTDVSSAAVRRPSTSMISTWR